jgi:serine/threonine protein kinase/tetratricopeptide (TPR) repeat protein
MPLTQPRSPKEDARMGLRATFISGSGRPNLDDPSLEPGPLGDLAEEFLERRQRGERPTVEEYAARFPKLAEQIRAFFPALLVVEDLKPGAADITGSFLGTGALIAGTVPERLADYRIIREVGRGGMGVVYEAEQESLGRRVALKVLASSALLDPQRVARFHREAKAAARLHHTNIVPVFGVGESQGIHYYVMQFITGAGLDAVLEDVRRLQGGHDGAAAERALSPHDLTRAIHALDGAEPEPSDPVGVASPISSPASGASVLSAASEPGTCYSRSVAHVGVQVAEALEYAHQQGTLHRDVKPSNILLDSHGIAWVTDFGLAKAAADANLTHTGDIVGTIRYMAPERFHGRCDARSDVYGLGLTLYELLARRPAFDASDRNRLIHQVGVVEPTRLRKLDPLIPRDLETIIHKAIEKDPAHRYATAGALADDLRCLLEDRPIRARRATWPERAWRWSRRNRATAALAVVAAASLVTTAIVGWAGYATATRALDGESFRRKEAETATRRAEENMELSLAVFEQLFERLAPGDTLPPPPLGLSVRQSPGGPEARRRPHFGGPGADRGGRPPGKSATPPQEITSDSDSTFLRSILNFYERFATRNATNPKLQAEAAWAYRKVGALNERLGFGAEAEEAYARAIGMFEDLVASDRALPEYRYKLVQTYDIADPWTAEASSLPGLEKRLRRAGVLIDRLATESPTDAEYAHTRIHVQAKLGMTLQRLKQLDEAEACYLRALRLEEAQLEQAPADGRTAFDRATTRHALATLLLARGRKHEAILQLKTAADEIEALVKNDRSQVPPPGVFERLGEALEDIGESDRAQEMYLWAEWAMRRGRGFRPSHDRGHEPPDERDGLPPGPPEPRISP